MPSLHGSRLCTDYGLERKVQHGSTVYLFCILSLLGLHAELNSASARRALSWALFNYTLECWGESSVKIPSSGEANSWHTDVKRIRIEADGAILPPVWSTNDALSVKLTLPPVYPHQECVQHLLLQQKQARKDLELPFFLSFHRWVLHVILAIYFLTF